MLHKYPEKINEFVREDDYEDIDDPAGLRDINDLVLNML